jgi:hypothetical protein
MPETLRKATMNRNGFHAPVLTHSTSQNKFTELQHVLGVRILLSALPSLSLF